MKKKKRVQVTKKIIYIFIIIITTIFILICTSIELKYIFIKGKNILPTTSTNIVPDVLEKEKINELFSEDIDINMAKKEFNNSDIVGRLEIPGMFNLIICQSKDNEYYTYYNINKKRDVKGTEFLDFRNDVTDKQINIYGHNSRTYDVPFRKLEKFLDKDFFNNNKYILFQHEKGRRIYEISSIKKVGKDYSHMNLMKTDTKDQISTLISNSVNSRDIQYSDNTNVLILQTCVEGDSGNYYIVVGFEI